MASRNRVLMRVAAEISSRETPRISRSRRRCSPKGIEDIRRGPQKYRRRLKGCQSWPESTPEGWAIGLSAIAPECTLRQEKSVHYNASVASRTPRREAGGPPRTDAPSRRREAVRRRGTPPPCGRGTSYARKHGSQRLSRTRQSPNVVATARSGLAHHHGKDQRGTASGYLVLAPDGCGQARTLFPDCHRSGSRSPQGRAHQS